MELGVTDLILKDASVSSLTITISGIITILTRIELTGISKKQFRNLCSYHPWFPQQSYFNLPNVPWDNKVQKQPTLQSVFEKTCAFSSKNKKINKTTFWKIYKFYLLQDLSINWFWEPLVK